MIQPATMTIPEAAALLGIGRNNAYETAARDGQLAGVQVIRVGRRLVIPRAPLLDVLGLTNGNGPAGAEPSPSSKSTSEDQGTGESPFTSSGSA